MCLRCTCRPLLAEFRGHPRGQSVHSGQTARPGATCVLPGPTRVTEITADGGLADPLGARELGARVVIEESVPSGAIPTPGSSPSPDPVGELHAVGLSVSLRLSARAGVGGRSLRRISRVPGWSGLKVDLGDLHGKRPPRAVSVRQRHRRLRHSSRTGAPAAGQVPRPSAHPLLAQRREPPTARAPGRLRTGTVSPRSPTPAANGGSATGCPPFWDCAPRQWPPDA